MIRFAFLLALTGCGAVGSNVTACSNPTRIDDFWQGTHTITQTFSFSKGYTQVLGCASSSDPRPSVAFNWVADKDGSSSFKFALTNTGSTDDLVLAIFRAGTCVGALACGGETIGSLKPALYFDVRNGTDYTFVVSAKSAMPPPGNFTLRLGD